MGDHVGNFRGCAARIKVCRKDLCWSIGDLVGEFSRTYMSEDKNVSKRLVLIYEGQYKALRASMNN